jgi:DNA-binding MarR family transcriptional regulator/N-acetylglutamate synthase-like GNAT family acetyltransferase
MTLSSIVMASKQQSERVQRVRQFNRVYTQRIGLLQRSYLDGAYSLTHVRVLYELGQHTDATASVLGGKLGVDLGYLSRILKRFEKDKLLVRTRASADGRQALLNLSARGRALFAHYQARAGEETQALIATMSEDEQGRLVDAMAAIEQLLEPAAAPARAAPAFILRTHRAGDLGYIVHRHGVLYAQEYGWGPRFEALVADIAARFLRDYDARYAQCWVAERGTEIVGTVLVTRLSKTIAQLRLLLVEPSARGLGVGRRLVEECVRFAKAAGYRKLTLWTNDNLHAARRIYEAAGFQLVASQKHSDFGVPLTGQTWTLKL